LTSVVRTALRLNFGEELARRIHVISTPLLKWKQQVFREMLTRLVSIPDIAVSVAKSLDMDAMFSQMSLPQTQDVRVRSARQTRAAARRCRAESARERQRQSHRRAGEPAGGAAARAFHGQMPKLPKLPSTCRPAQLIGLWSIEPQAFEKLQEQALAALSARQLEIVSRQSKELVDEERADPYQTDGAASRTSPSTGR
jgi:hypothetical protein